ncbi:MoaD/ThiS family protein [Parasedimentitalea denitrificans]|uniref:MoaD/ThiS family protein n=1 Tax=Parasedimentitalea denitrificans TaxID=2211118 RepID=UPI0034E1F1A8
MKIEVHLWSGLRTLTDGLEKVEVEASNTGELLDALAKDYPALVPVIEAGVSIAIDGRIIATGLMEPLRPDQEIYLMQRLKGG